MVYLIIHTAHISNCFAYVGDSARLQVLLGRYILLGL